MIASHVTQKLRRWAITAAFLLALIYRLYAAFQTPQVSTDAFRNLGYSSHAFDDGIAIYDTTAADYDNEIWARFNVWNELTYQYPPVTLTFFYFFSILGLGIFWVKIVLTAVELVCSYILGKRVSKVAAALYFCAPVSLWYTSHEGQFEPLQTLFIILTATAVNDRHWRRAGLFLAVSIQVKLWGVLLLPWMIVEMWQQRHEGRIVGVVTEVVEGMVVGILPFIWFYIRTPDLLLITIRITGVGSTNYNPFAWNFTDPDRFGWNSTWLIYWNAVLTLAPLLILVITFVRVKGVEARISLLPLASLLVIVKSLRWGQFWYSIVGPGYLFCFEKRRRLVVLLLVFYLVQGGRSMALISGSRFGHQEDPRNRALMERCMFKCDVQSETGLPDATAGLSQ